MLKEVLADVRLLVEKERVEEDGRGREHTNNRPNDKTYVLILADSANPHQ
jgi:hypothetical protein